VLNEASASALRDVIAKEGISEQQREARMAEVRERRMQELLYAITVLASNSGGAGESWWMGVVWEWVGERQGAPGGCGKG
jgi:hypothetical protein